MYKVKIDTEICIGCGACVAICEKVFEMKGDKAVVKKQKTNEPNLKDAVESCPVKAIIIEKS